MGEAASEFIVETIVALVESDPTAPDGAPMWSIARGDQITDALSEQSLALGLSRMTKQRDDTNRRIGVRVATLLLGDPQLAWIADRISPSP